MTTQDMGDVAVLLAFVSTPAVWYLVTRTFNKRNKWPILRHVVMAVFSPLVFFSIFGLVIEPGWFSAFFALIIFGPLYALARPRRSDPSAPLGSPATVEALPLSNGHSAPSIAPSESARLDAEASRLESLAAIQRATKARDIDKRREDPIEDPLARWKAGTPHSEHSYSPTEPSEKSIVHGKRLDVIRFDYLNAKGEFSPRRVKVTMVGQWNFEGIDLHKREARTFRHDRVVGDVTSELTGEALDPAEWASSILYRSAAVDA